MAVMDTSYLCPISGTLASDFAPWPLRWAGRRIFRAATSIIYTQGSSVLQPGTDISLEFSLHSTHTGPYDLDWTGVNPLSYCNRSGFILVEPGKHILYMVVKLVAYLFML